MEGLSCLSTRSYAYTLFKCREDDISYLNNLTSQNLSFSASFLKSNNYYLLFWQAKSLLTRLHVSVTWEWS